MFDSDLARYDAFFFVTTGSLTEAGTDNALPMSAQGKALLAAIRDRKGFLGVHSASDTFRSKGRRFERSSSRTRISRCLAASSSATEANKRRV